MATWEALAFDEDIPVKAIGSELDTGTDDAKFVTAKAINDSHNVPSVAPGTSGNVMKSDGTDWTSAAGVPSATAESDFIVSGASPFAWLKKTLAEVKTILGLGTAAYTAATDYVTHALATVANDFLVASGSGVFVKKTLAETLTILLSSALAENDSIILDDVLSADGKYCGITEAGTAGAALAFGEIVYLAVADSRWELAKADVAATSKGKVGICVLAAAGDGSATKILLWGKVRADAKFPAFTVGAPVFISAATAGLLTSTAPSGTTNFVVRIVGEANTADELFFCPSPDYIELA